MKIIHIKIIHILIIILILLIVFSIINSHLKKDIKEHYLTYFLPFYDNKITELTNFYNNDENNLNYFKKKINYYPIKFGTNKEDKDFTKNFLVNYVSKSLNMETQNIVYTDSLKCIDNLSTGNIEFCLIDPLTTYYYNEELHKSLNNLRLVTSLYKTYIYMFTLKTYGVYTINDIPLNFKIGLIKNNSFTLYYKKFLFDLGYSEGENYIIVYKDSIKDLLNSLNDGTVNMIILYQIYPQKDISYLLNEISNPEIILLPFEPNNEDLFLKKNFFLKVESVDLNYLSPSYLPRKFGNSEYLKFRPSMKMCYTYIHILSSINTPEEFNYDFVKFYYENFKYINTTFEDGYKINLIQEKDHIPYHQGVLKYFKDYGYISNIDNDNCRFLIGRMECNEKTLKDNNLWLTL
jgi:TRAP-type uncharacterized transport system substrate-binding protein